MVSRTSIVGNKDSFYDREILVAGIVVHFFRCTSGIGKHLCFLLK